MNKLTKLMLASAMMITSGFAGEAYSGVAELADKSEVEIGSLPNGIKSNYKMMSGSAISVVKDVTLNRNYSITLEIGSTGTIANSKTLSNEGEIIMSWDPSSPGVFGPNGGKILQVSETRQAWVYSDFDAKGAAKWYKYTGTWNGSEGTWYNKTAGLNSISLDEGWYGKGKSDYNYMYTTTQFASSFNNIEAKLTGPIKVTVKGSITFKNIDSLKYVSGDGCVLDVDTTNLSGSSLSEKNAKKLISSESGFTPDIKNGVAPISCVTEQGTVQFGAAMDDIDNAESFTEYLNGFGLSFKTSNEGDSAISFVANLPAIEAISGAAAEDAVLIENVEIAVDDNAGVIASLHNIGVENAAPSFSGSGTLILSGENRELQKATMSCPVEISGTNSIPTNATFKNDLTISTNSAVASENILKAEMGLRVKDGKKLTVSGKLVIGDVSAG